MRDKIIIFSIAFLIIGILIFVAHNQFIKTKREFVDLYSEKQVTLARQAALSIEHYIKERIKALEILADFPASRKLEKEIFLKEYQRTYEKIHGFTSIVFLNKNGQATAGYPPSYLCPPLDVTDTQKHFYKFFLQLQNSHNSLIYSRNIPLDGKIFVCFLTPIYSYGHRFRGAIMGTIDIGEALRSALVPIIDEANDYAWLLNDQGFLIYHPTHENMLLRNIFARGERCFDCHSNFDLEEKMIEREAGVGIKKNVFTATQLVGYARVPLKNTNWIIAVSSPYHIVTEAVNRQYKGFLIVIILMILTVVIGAFFINRANTQRVIAQKRSEYLLAKNALMEAKEAAELRYRTLVEQSPDPIFLCTLKQIILVNESFEKLFEYDKKELFAKDFRIVQMIDRSNLKYFNKQIKEFLKSRRQFGQLSLNLRSKSGKLIEADISFVRFWFDKRLTFQGIIHDVTETRRLEREKRRREHLAFIGEMAARIAHEIKNPLTSIQTGIQILQSQSTINDSDRQYYRRLREEISRVDGILRGLLSYAREDKLHRRKLKIGPLIYAFTEIIEPTLKKHAVHLSLNIQNNLPEIYIDKEKFEQVLWNLVLNAVQASKPRSLIQINVFQNEDGIDIQIIDQGEGISRKNLQKIFFPFFSTRTQGSGLGLAISKKIIEAHDGTIEIESKLHRGTTVRIHLPGGKIKV